MVKALARMNHEGTTFRLDSSRIELSEAFLVAIFDVLFSLVENRGCFHAVPVMCH